MIRNRCHQGLVGHTKHLTLLTEAAQQIGHRSTDAATDASIDLVKQQRAGAVHCGKGGLQRQQKTRHLTARRHLHQRCQWLTGIRGKQKRDSIRSMVCRFGRTQIHLKTHIGEAHWGQQLEQGSLKIDGSLRTGLTQGGIGLIPLLALRLFDHPQPLKIRFESPIAQPLP